VWSINKNIKDEKGVANFYDKTTGMFCTQLASTLALHPKASTSNWRPLLEWTQSVSSSGYAIMGGELRIIAAASDDEAVAHEMIVQTMESETRRIFDEIRDSRDPFATWEIKSPFAGPLEVMLVVPNLGIFHGRLVPIRSASRTRSISMRSRRPKTSKWELTRWLLRGM